MIELKLDGKALPAALLIGVPYSIDILIDGVAPLFVEWSITASAVVVSRGTGNISNFAPASAVTHFITVKALRSTGFGEETITAVGASLRRSTVPSVTVAWSRLTYSLGEVAEANIIYKDPEGLAPQSISWALFHNNVQISAGTDRHAEISSAQFGLYRLRVTVVDAEGASTTADSTVKVDGGFAQQAALPPVQPENTLQRLGYVYSKPVKAGAVTASTLPFEVASHFQVVALLPGTTHFKLSLDPDNSTVDDEIVVRLRNGNWALVGPPTGFSTEAVGYDYLLDLQFIPAPADLRLRATFDVWNAHGIATTESSPVVRFECYRETVKVYEYSPCTFSEFPGGEAARQRRLAVLFTDMEVDIDANNIVSQASFPTSTYSTANANRFIGRLSASGAPDTTLTSRGLSLTEANMYAIYSSASGNDPLEAFGVYGIDGTRPFVVCLTKPSAQALIRRPRRVYGKMSVYMSGGGILAGSSVTASILTSKAPGQVDFNVPVVSDVYNSSLDEFVKVGEVDVDVTDYGFSNGGIAVDLSINE